MATTSHRKKRTSPARTRNKAARAVNLKNTGEAAKLPLTVPPMLATLVDKPFDAENWLFEVKWDGYRAIAICNKNNVSLISRNNKSFNEKFYPITAALQQLGLHAVLDGEIIISNKEGVSSFGDLQNWRSEADGELLYYVFDLLWYDGRQLYNVPLQQRRELLKEILPESPSIQLSQSFNAPGTSFYEVAKQMNLEGIIAKKADSLYTPGVRTKEWLKIKIAKRQEVVIGGFTLNEGSRKTFSSLLVGVFENGKLHYTGKIGTGFTDKVQQEMMQQFKPLMQKTCPFDVEPDYNKPSRFRPNPPKAVATWLKPELVCEVSFAEITSDGVMRHPSFEGMRVDKKAKDVKADKAKPTRKVVKESILHKEKIITRRKAGERKTLLNPGEKQQERAINGHTLKFTNLNKIYWPKEKITKRDLLNYYYQVAPVILPYLKDRPQSLNRYPNGIEGESFYQKNVSGKIPDWIDTFPYTSEGINKSFLVPTQEADLLYMASLGCIEMNPWSSTVKKPDNPDWCAIDLDPDTNSFEQVIKTAQITHEVLESAGIANYCKTSGSTGIHIYIPLGAKYLYEDSREFGRLIATIVHEQIPRFTSIERATADRKGKIYIDFLQNRPQATLAAAYSLRPKPGATVSMPLHWDEVKKGLKMKDWTIRNAVARIKEQGDIFKPVLGKGINMKKAIAALGSLYR
jgi:bifunctional non-homologous end joining protein LigD